MLSTLLCCGFVCAVGFRIPLESNMSDASIQLGVASVVPNVASFVNVLTRFPMFEKNDFASLDASFIWKLISKLDIFGFFVVLKSF